jgi:hypothetical protein
VDAEKPENQMDEVIDVTKPSVILVQMTQEVQPPKLVISGAQMEAKASEIFLDL